MNYWAARVAELNRKYGMGWDLVSRREMAVWRRLWK
jgi:hypothetical protein